MPKLASIEATTSQKVAAGFTVINVITNIILVALLVTGGIAVRSTYITVVQNMDENTVANAKQMFSDATYFVHQARMKFEANDGSLPFNVTEIVVATTYAMDGITAALMSVDKNAIHNATSMLGLPSTQAFIQTSIERVLGDVERLQLYIDTIASLLNRIQVNPTSFIAALLSPPSPKSNG